MERVADMADRETVPESPDLGKPGPAACYSARRRRFFLLILFLVATSSYADRQLISVLLEPIKAEFKVSDAWLGVLSGFAFALLYATLGLPAARWADRGNRRLMIGCTLALWSVMTALCGVATSFWQLALARVGVGIGEAGGIPASQSLIADYFPPDRRARALGILMASGTLGYLLAFGAGSQIAAAYGWRAAFLLLGVPGLALVVLTLFLDEPRKSRVFKKTDANSETMFETMRLLSGKPTFILTLVSLVLYFAISYGALLWIPSHLVRILGVRLEDVGLSFGLAGAISSVLGTIGGGILSDWLARKDARWLGWLPGSLLILCWPFHHLAFMASSYALFLGSIFVGTMLQSATTPAAFAMIHHVCGPSRRAMAVALVFFFGNLIGMGFGSWLTGLLSDGFGVAYGTQGLRYALLAMVLLYLPAGWALLRAAKTLQRDAEG